MGQNQNKAGPQIARLDSLFYKKQTQQKQTNLEESKFKRIDNHHCSSKDLVKRIINYDKKAVQKSLIEDRSFQSHLNWQILKIQQQIAKNMIPEGEDKDESIYFENHTFLKQDTQSIIIALKLYVESIKNFSFIKQRQL
eukprot:403331087